MELFSALDRFLTWEPNRFRDNVCHVDQLPYLIFGMPKNETPCFLTFTADRMIVSAQAVFLRILKRFDEDTPVMYRIQTWYKITLEDGRYVVSIADAPWTQTFKEVRRKCFPIGVLQLGYGVQQRCQVIKEELMQRTWHPRVIAKRMAQGREDLLD